jgi:pteridine reductase
MWQRPSPHFSHYAVSKAGLAILTRALASELAPAIRVNGVAPGLILFAPSLQNEAIKQEALDNIPFKRLGSTADIANAVIFLSDKALYATGEILVIDGGRSIAA